MRLFFKLKHHFFGAFRELFVHHHGSLEFRAKVLALVIAANESSNKEVYLIVKDIAECIYKEDEERVNLLILTTKEKVKKVKDDNGLDIDILVASIQKDLKIIPRYAQKIDINELQKLLLLTQDSDTLSYQENILEFLQNLKNQTLNVSEIKLDKNNL